MWGLHIDTIIIAVEHTCVIWQACMLWEYASYVKCMYTSAPSHIIDCSEYILSIYTDIVFDIYTGGDCIVTVKVF